MATTINSPLGPIMSAITTSAQDTMKSISNKQIQLATNQQHASFLTMGVQASSFASIESAYKANQAQIDNTLMMGPDFNILKNNATQLRELAENFSVIAKQAFDTYQETMVNHAQGHPPSYDYKGLSQTTLNDAIFKLNVGSSSRQLTSGSETDRLAVKVANLPNPNSYQLNANDDILPNAAPPAPRFPSWYEGDEHLNFIELDGQKINYSFTANELGPQRLIRATHILANADPADPNFKEKLENVLTVTHQAINDLRIIENRLGQAHVALTRAKKNIEIQNLDNEKQMESINGIDRPGVIAGMMGEQQLYNVQLSSLHMLLETNKMAISKIFG